MPSRLLLGLTLLLLVACGTATGGRDAAVDALQDTLPTDVVDTAPAPDIVLADAPVDVQNLALGAACTSDVQCASHVCIQSAGLTPGCAAPCTSDADCAAISGGDFCVLDHAVSGSRFACGTSTTGSIFDGQSCTQDSDCLSNVCRLGLCNAACATDADCSAGEHCLTGTLAGATLQACGQEPITGVTVDDYTVIDGTTRVDTGGANLFAVPNDVVSLTFIAEDLDQSNIFAAVPLLQAPDMTNWINAQTWNGITDQPVREIIGIYQVNSALAPSNDTLHVQGGSYNVTYALLNDASAMTTVRSAHLRGTARVKRAPGGVLPATGTLAVRLFFVGLTDVNAATAPTNARLQGALRQMQSIYATVGITVNVAGYADITGTDAATYRVIDSQAEFREVLALSASSTGDVINLFFVSSISASAGLEGAIGMAGDIVGPPGIHGTVHSGVVIGWDSTNVDGDLLGETTSHETGHYLGLWHTRENLAACVGTLSDTCSLFGGVDPISDTPTDQASAQSYLMFWQTDGTNLTLSPGEGIVMRSNPLVH